MEQRAAATKRLQFISGEDLHADVGLHNATHTYISMNTLRYVYVAFPLFCENECTLTLKYSLYVDF